MEFTLNSTDDKVASDDGDAIVHYIEQVKRHPLIDSSRIYVFGESGGGFVLLRNLCKLAGKVAAVGISGALPRWRDGQDWIGSGQPCSSGVNIPYIHIHGTADDNVPYEGVERSESKRRSLGDYTHLSVDDTVAQMAKRNKTNFTEVWELPDRSPKDSGIVGTQETYATTVTSMTHFANGLPMVRLLKVNGGGHQMPSLLPNYPAAQAFAISNYQSKDIREGRKARPVNLDIVGADEIAKFFMLHKLD